MLRLYPIRVLARRLKESGISESPILWVNRKQKSDKLRLRTIPNDYKGRRVVTDQDITEIISAFSPGGSGYWYYDGGNDETTQESSPTVAS